jgi:hypothetical protein
MSLRPSVTRNTVHDNEKRKVELRLNHVEELMSVGHSYPTEAR